MKLGRLKKKYGDVLYAIYLLRQVVGDKKTEDILEKELNKIYEDSIPKSNS